MWRRLLLLLCALAAAAGARAALVLDGASQRVELWPAVSVMFDATQQLGIEQAMAAPQRFAPPSTAYGTLGMHTEAAWLRVPVDVPAQADGRWILDIDYAVLNRIDVWVTRDGRVGPHYVLGNLQPYSQRPIQSRSHAVALELPPGADTVLYLRVQTLGAMALPLTLERASAFHQRSLAEQMLQGLLDGLGLCLLLYSVAQWLSLREPLFIKYAMLISGSLMFSVFQFGVGAQYLWTDNTWIELHAGGLSALVAAAGTFLFVEQALAGSARRRWFRRVMHGGAALLMVVALAYAADAIGVRAVSAVIGSIGLMPALLGTPGAVARARRGDAVGWYFLVAWLGYFVATAFMVGLIKGHVGVNFWSLHSFQFGATLDMLLFMRVLGLRTQAVHAAAQHATRERDALHSLAHTDPLTGLPNRRGLHAALNAALPHSTHDNLLAVYLLDLDGFKQVNDRHGHDTGDELLIAVARRLQASLRTSDVVARLGGDEFVVMASGLHSDPQAQELGTQMIAAFNQPFELSRHSCSVGLTIGYVLVPQDGRDVNGLLKRADAAMYAGKQGGKRCLRRGEAAAVF